MVLIKKVGLQQKLSKCSGRRSNQLRPVLFCRSAANCQLYTEYGIANYRRWNAAGFRCYPQRHRPDSSGQPQLLKAFWSGKASSAMIETILSWDSSLITATQILIRKGSLTTQVSIPNPPIFDKIRYCI